MDLQIKNHCFIICGAGSGMGEAVARQLIREGANTILVARNGNQLREKFSGFKEQVQFIEGNLLHSQTLDEIEAAAEENEVEGLFLNAGGPPTGAPLQTVMKDWDAAWQLMMRWKIDLCLRITPILINKGYGRILFLESQSVKQPLPDLALSNTFRAGVVGFAKSLAMEVAAKGVTVNVIAPGSHDTPSIERIIKANSSKLKLSYKDTKERMEQNIPVGRMGKAEELASLAAWLLSPHSSYITGQTISHEGGNIRGLFG